MTARSFDVASLFPNMRVASEAEIEAHERARRLEERRANLMRSGIGSTISEEDREAVISGRVRKTAALGAVVQWHRGEPPPGAPLRALGDASPGLLMLCGGMGIGKSFAAAWWASMAPCRWVTFPDFCAIFRTAMRAEHYVDERRSRLDVLGNADHVVLDELGVTTRLGKDVEREAWHWLVENRKGKRKRTIVLTNKSLGDIVKCHRDGTFDDRTGDRLKDAQLVELAGESMRGKGSE